MQIDSVGINLGKTTFLLVVGGSLAHRRTLQNDIAVPFGPGHHESAVRHYRSAAIRTTSIPEQDYLMAQEARLEEGLGGGTGEETIAP